MAKYWLQLFLRTTSIPSTFFHFISNIIKVSAKPQMFRIYADRVVTFMKNMKTFIKLAIREFVTKTMYRNRFIINTELPVKSRLSNTRFSKPRPTFLRLFNIFPKTKFRSSIKRMTVSPPSFIMHQTPFMGFPLTFTSFYKTLILFVSHIISLPHPRGNY